MSDVTETPDQQEAILNSLVDPDNAVAISDEQAQISDDPGTETPDTTETGVEGVEPEETEEETADDWLPTEQEKVFPPEVLQRYAKRYGYTEEEVQGDPRIAQLVHDKINTDIYLNSLQERQQQETEEEKPQPTQPIEPLTVEKHLENLTTWAKQNTDPRIAQEFANSFLDAFDVRDDKGNAVKATPEMAQKLTTSLSVGALNLMQTALPHVLPQMVEQIFPGFQGMYYRSSRASSWDGVRNSNEQYSSLPAYGSQEFLAMCERVRESNPLLDEMGDTLAAKHGGQLVGPDADKFYAMLARVAVGSKVTSAEIKTALEKGRLSANKQAQRRASANLGAGQSKGKITSDGTTGDPLRDLFGEGLDIAKEREGRI